MRINAISNIHNNISLTGKKKGNHKNVQKDCFIKTTSVSSKTDSPKNEEMNKFLKTVRKYYFDQPFDIEKLGKDVNEFASELTVRPFSEAPKDIRERFNFAGLFVAPLVVNEETGEIGYDNSKKELFLSTPKSSAFEKLFFYSNAAHEYTLYLNSKDKEKSEANFINEYAKNHKCDNKTAERTIQATSQFTALVSDFATKPLNKAITNLPLSKKVQNNFQKGNSLQYAFSLQGLGNVDKYIEKAFDSISQRYKNETEEYDTDFLRDFAIFHCKNDYEAYKNGFDAMVQEVPEYAKHSGSWTERARLDLFSRLANLPIEKKWAKQ